VRLWYFRLNAPCTGATADTRINVVVSSLSPRCGTRWIPVRAKTRRHRAPQSPDVSRNSVERSCCLKSICEACAIWTVGQKRHMELIDHALPQQNPPKSSTTNLAYLAIGLLFTDFRSLLVNGNWSLSGLKPAMKGVRSRYLNRYALIWFQGVYKDRFFTMITASGLQRIFQRPSLCIGSEPPTVNQRNWKAPEYFEIRNRHLSCNRPHPLLDGRLPCSPWRWTNSVGVSLPIKIQITI